MPIGTNNPLIFQDTLPELAPSRRFGGCRGIVGPVPPPLWIRVSDYVVSTERGRITPMRNHVNKSSNADISPELDCRTGESTIERSVTNKGLPQVVVPSWRVSTLSASARFLGQWASS